MLQLFGRYDVMLAECQCIREETERRLGISIPSLDLEHGYYVQLSGSLSAAKFDTLCWLLGGAVRGSDLEPHSATVLEVGPRLNFETAWSTTAVSICRACGLEQVERIERTARYGLGATLTDEQVEAFLAPLMDRMTQLRYATPLTSFDSGLSPAGVREIELMTRGRIALAEISDLLGFGWDGQDFDFIERLFTVTLGRNPTDVELFQLAQANSEHSRHHFFRGVLTVDGQPLGQTLMDIVKAPWCATPGNSVIAFKDNSSAIRGSRVPVLVDEQPGCSGPLEVRHRRRNSTLTAETHNFPSGVAPYPGAATGTGGRIRDNQAVGRGGLVTAAAAGYCVGNLRLPRQFLVWEQDGWQPPTRLATPLDILIQASNGASDYGNCFGEPVIYGFVRTCGMELPDGYRSWYKPVMYSAGVGQVDDEHVEKLPPERGMLVVQLGGPAYRIGLGGGAASSVVQGERDEQLDFDAVQRGDPQMEQRMNRVVRACVELGDSNPIVSMHDLGAGGCCNAFTEIVESAGAVIDLRAIPLGDQSLSPREIWGNESQERNVILVRTNDYEVVEQLARRENVPCAVVGRVTDDGLLIAQDANDGSTPVRLPLDLILSQLPQKSFDLQRVTPRRDPLQLPDGLTVLAALNRILRLVSVGSKRFLTNKVDRSVTGLVVQQQCVGPHHLPLADYGAVALSHFDEVGTAMSLGEQPIKGLVSPSAMARLAVAEALLNLSGAKISRLEDIRCSANWMLAAKQPGEGAWLVDAAVALRDACLALGIAIDGGKDSLSMATNATAPDGTEQTVKAPGELVINMYAPMPDVNVRVTPDLKRVGNGLVFIDLSDGSNSLGGSALAQAHGQVGDSCPDAADFDVLKRAFETAQDLIARGQIVSLHDRSDGGLITAALEMAFAGNVGLELNLTGDDFIAELFSEGPGLVIETESPEYVVAVFKSNGVIARQIGRVCGARNGVVIYHNGTEVLRESMAFLRATWESTSSDIDRLQANPACVDLESRFNAVLLDEPQYRVWFAPQVTPTVRLLVADKPRVAILREQGSNGDREMAAAFMFAGFEPWDVTMTDLLAGRVTLDEFRGIAFVGGFSFADVLGAGRGWAGVIRHNAALSEQFRKYYERPDTFSLGVCNGCQLMAQLGWVPGFDGPDSSVEFVRNVSGRFESRFSTVQINDSPSIMLRGMNGSRLGVWVAHGEGRLHTGPATATRIQVEGLAPIRYVDHEGVVTERYPFNPNGSPRGITALCSPDGRHLAMMPHPERTFLLRQWPWLPESFKKLAASPWLKLFQNAREWCEEG